MIDAQDDYKNLVEHWNNVFAISDAEKEDVRESQGSYEGLKDLAPSEKLYKAAASLGDCKNVLDYGSGSGWAGVIAAKTGCEKVTCADPAKNAATLAVLNAKQFGVKDKIQALVIDDKWLETLPDGAFDGIICSNVLDVIPPEMTDYILKHMARIIWKDRPIIIGFNNYISPAVAERSRMKFQDGNLLYINGILRMVNRSDQEWKTIFEKYFLVEKLDYFAWPGEQTEGRRLFYLRSHK